MDSTYRRDRSGLPLVLPRLRILFYRVYSAQLRKVPSRVYADVLLLPRASRGKSDSLHRHQA